MASAADTHDHTNVEELRAALFGRSVVSVRMGEFSEQIAYSETVQGEVQLDDGTVLKLAGNTGGCICGAGDYDLSRLNDMPINGITDVEVDVEDKDEYGEKVYRIFVLAQDDRIELASFDGDDGNGYYGTGFWFAVVR
jgi:hypothetical protein